MNILKQKIKSSGNPKTHSHLACLKTASAFPLKRPTGSSLKKKIKRSENQTRLTASRSHKKKEKIRNRIKLRRSNVKPVSFRHLKKPPKKRPEFREYSLNTSDANSVSLSRSRSRKMGKFNFLSRRKNENVNFVLKDTFHSIREAEGDSDFPSIRKFEKFLLVNREKKEVFSGEDVKQLRRIRRMIESIEAEHSLGKFSTAISGFAKEEYDYCGGRGTGGGSGEQVDKVEGAFCGKGGEYDYEEMKVDDIGTQQKHVQINKFTCTKKTEHIKRDMHMTHNMTNQKPRPISQQNPTQKNRKNQNTENDPKPHKPQPSTFHFISDSHFTCDHPTPSNGIPLFPKPHELGRQLLSAESLFKYNSQNTETGLKLPYTSTGTTAYNKSTRTPEQIAADFVDLFLKKRLSKEQVRRTLKKIKEGLFIPYNARRSKESLNNLVKKVSKYYLSAYDETFFTENFITIVNENLKHKRLDFNFKAKYLAFKSIFCGLIDEVSSISQEFGRHAESILDVRLSAKDFEQVLVDKIAGGFESFLEGLPGKRKRAKEHLNYQSV